MNPPLKLCRGSFDVIVGMDWLSKRKFVIVCHEKVVRIPLEGDEILQVHGERTQGVVKTLMNTKHGVHLKLVLELLRKEKLYAKFTKSEAVKNWEIVKPLTSLTERNQKYEWGAEREEAFQTLKNDLYVKDKILATPSETSKVENAPAEMLRDLDQQMEKRADDGKANVVTDALSRKERVKPRRVRAMAMTIQYGVRGMILAAQSEAFKQENLYNKRYQDVKVGKRFILEDIIARNGTLIGESSLIGPELVQEMTDKVVLIKEKLKAARDRQKSYPLEFEVGDRVMLKVSP
ncbi:hypothetical protein Tco_0696762 [Tanacetum coccineum]